jgi:hypothetical protein
MKHFLIKYRFADGTAEPWHEEIRRFIAALEADADLRDRISYSCMRVRNELGEYYHLAAARDDEAVRMLQSRAWFSEYTAETKRVSGGSVEVVSLETIAATRLRP